MSNSSTLFDRECDAGFTLGCMSCMSCRTRVMSNLFNSSDSSLKTFQKCTVFNSLTHHYLFAFCCFLHQKTTHQSKPPPIKKPPWPTSQIFPHTPSKVIQLTFIWKTEEFNEAAQCWHHLEKSLPLNNSTVAAAGTFTSSSSRSVSKRLITNIKV